MVLAIAEPDLNDGPERIAPMTGRASRVSAGDVVQVVANGGGARPLGVCVRPARP